METQVLRVCGVGGWVHIGGNAQLVKPQAYLLTAVSLGGCRVVGLNGGPGLRWH